MAGIEEVDGDGAGGGGGEPIGERSAACGNGKSAPVRDKCGFDPTREFDPLHFTGWNTSRTGISYSALEAPVIGHMAKPATHPFPRWAAHFTFFFRF